MRQRTREQTSKSHKTAPTKKKSPTSALQITTSQRQEHCSNKRTDINRKLKAKPGESAKEVERKRGRATQPVFKSMWLLAHARILSIYTWSGTHVRSRNPQTRDRLFGLPPDRRRLHAWRESRGKEQERERERERDARPREPGHPGEGRLLSDRGSFRNDKSCRWQDNDRIDANCTDIHTHARPALADIASRFHYIFVVRGSCSLSLYRGKEEKNNAEMVWRDCWQD